MHACSWCSDNCIVIAVVTTCLADAKVKWHWSRTAHAIGLAFPSWPECSGRAINGGYSCSNAESGGVYFSVSVDTNVNIGVSVNPVTDARHCSHIARRHICFTLAAST